jgi:hypothetical protein
MNPFKPNGRNKPGTRLPPKPQPKAPIRDYAALERGSGAEQPYVDARMPGAPMWSEQVFPYWRAPDAEDDKP